MNTLERRCIEISYKNRLTHVSSVLNTVNTLDAIYARRAIADPVLLCNCHASLAHYVVLEAHGLCNAQEMVEKHGTHAHRDMEHGVWASGGSLGQLEPIAVGMALADRKRNVWLVTSDGACAEGSVWEAFRLASEQRLGNLHIYVIANGLGAYGPIDTDKLRDRLAFFLYPLTFEFVSPKMPFQWLEGLDGHYMKISDEQFKEAMK